MSETDAVHFDRGGPLKALPRRRGGDAGRRLAILAAFWLVAALLLPAGASPAGFEQRFEAANQAYAKGGYEAARDQYRSIVAEGGWSANLFYNLGNAEYRLGDQPAAFLAYERALALDPSHPEAAANLALLRSETGARVVTPGLKERALLWPLTATAHRASWIAAGAFWVLLLAFAPRLWKGRCAPLTGVVAGLVLAWCVTALVAEARRGPLWLVTGKKITARVAPADTSKVAATLPMGSRVHLLLDRGEWLLVTLPDATTGWIGRREVEPVALPQKG
ncbi:MAG TPA: tetratricopeptide repeat protein [Chthoniobacteraceae bacterium]|nr:tetratricopeptide repeat protein [Chthoniobacteraceae bacterium]